MPARVNSLTVVIEASVDPPTPVTRRPSADCNLRLNCAAVAALIMLKNAPLSKTNCTSPPLIFAVITGLRPLIVMGSSALESLHLEAAWTGATARWALRGSRRETAPSLRYQIAE